MEHYFLVPIAVAGKQRCCKLRGNLYCLGEGNGPGPPKK